MSIGELIDKMATIDKEVSKLQALIKKHNERRSLVEKKLMRAFEKQGINKASGKLANALDSSRRHPTIKDLAKLNKYIQKRGAYDLYQRRINAKAYFDRLEQGEAVPGIEVFERHFIKLTPKRG